MKSDPYSRRRKNPPPLERLATPRGRRRRERRFRRHGDVFSGDRTEKAVGQEEGWRYTDRRVYVEGSGRKRLPAWVIPAITLIVLGLAVFVVAPYVVSAIQGRIAPSPGVEPQDIRLFGDDTRIVRIVAADLLDRPDLRGTRITQVLYNTPVLLDGPQTAYGYASVRLADGTAGFIATRDLTVQRDSAEPYMHRYKLVVADRVRRVMSHASRGTLLTEVMMGTVLYSDYRGDGIYRIALPGGGTGWIGRNGLIELSVDADVEESGAGYFVSSALTFLNMTYLPGGTTLYGIDSVGLIRVASSVNGVPLPAAVPGFATAGSGVPLVRDEKTGHWKTDGWANGDLVLFAAASASEGERPPVDAAVYIGGGQVLMARPNRSSIRLVTLGDDPELLDRVVSVRRVFTKP